MRFSQSRPARFGIAAVLCGALALGGCTTTGSANATADRGSGDDGAAYAATTESEGPYPSTYAPYPGVPTALVGAVVFDGAGNRIDFAATNLVTCVPWSSWTGTGSTPASPRPTAEKERSRGARIALQTTIVPRTTNPPPSALKTFSDIIGLLVVLLILVSCRVYRTQT